ncbi:hypothetical protein FJ434_20670 [Mesorhizobium sp. B2-5-13]|nr:hypothetical protein FJ434_20670 [Mesorhizobium sp. B2-5-13]TPK45935.1 hypothetical protein FJ560_19885 [Mesorhizobium sp. B2-5-5]
MSEDRICVTSAVPTLAPSITAWPSLVRRDPEAIWGKLLDAGISMIQTDYPNELRSFLDCRGRP